MEVVASQKEVFPFLGTLILKISMNRFILLFSSFFAILGFFSMNGQTQLDSGLIGFFPFSGNAIDSSGLYNSGTVNGPVLIDDRFGQSSSAYWFDGIDDVITINSYSQMSPIVEVSVSAWVKTDQAPGLAYTAIYDRLEANDGFALVIRPNGTIRFSINGGLGIATSSKSVLDDEWHFVAGTYNKSTGLIKVYIDCVQDGQGSYNTDITYSPEPRNSIGGPGGLSTSFFYGAMDGLRVYERELDFTDVGVLCSDTLPTVGIEDSKVIASKIEIYPNPASDEAHIKVRNVGGLAILAIYNAKGQLVLEQNVFPSMEVITIDIKDLKESIYIMRIVEGGMVYTKKLMIKRS